MARSYIYNKCEIEGRNDTRSPHMQAHDGLWKLKDFFDRELRRSPRMTASACFPHITRREWNNKFGTDARITGDFSKSLIFDCDLSDSNSLKERLQHIWYNPPMREGAKFQFSFAKPLIDDITKTVAPIPQKPRIASSDIERLQALEKLVRNQAINDCPIDKQTKILFTGRPGTGKTFRLVAIGIAHAMAGKRVLFVCFNKTLSADISRLILLKEELRQQLIAERAVFDIFDISRFAQRYISGHEDGYEQWLETALKNADELRELSTYDLVLVDEAQDMYEPGLQLISRHSGINTSVCVAAGSGQELYGNASFWLEDFETDPRTRDIKLKRNFRNTLPIYQVAQIFYESNLNIEKAKKFVDKFKQTQKTQLEFEFDRPHGEWPSVRRIDDSNLKWDEADSIIFEGELDNLMIREYEQIIDQQIDALTNREMPMDILVLVPGPNYTERNWAYEALKNITERRNINFLDYTDDKNRRQPAHPQFIRLCPYASARGLEGYRTIILGFENIENLCKNTAMTLINLGYIVLSRAVFETILASRVMRDNLPAIKHTVSCIRILKERINANN